MIDLHPTAGPRLALELRAEPGGLAVRVVGESSGGERLTIQPPDEIRLLMAQPTFHEAIGRDLFRALNVGSVGEQVRAALADARQAGQPLALELHFDPGALHAAAYPWELLHDGARFLLHAGALTLVRCVPVPALPLPPSRPDEPLTLLAITATPSGRPVRRADGSALGEALAPWVSASRLDLATLRPATWDALRAWVLAGAPDVLHLESGGAAPEAALVLEDARGEPDPVSADLFGALLGGSRLRLAVWIGAGSAENAGAADQIAPALIRAGLPAVVALPHSLPGESTRLTDRFLRAFYSALFEGAPLESAFEGARRTLHRSAAWHIPLLYRQVPQPLPEAASPPCRVTVITPQQVMLHQPARAGLWLLPEESPPPDPVAAGRLLGITAAEWASVDVTPVLPPRAGLVQVTAQAEDCALQADHTWTVIAAPAQGIASAPVHPLWFSLVPQRAGRIALRIMLQQAGSTFATVTHSLEVTAGDAPAPADRWSLADLLTDSAPPAGAAPAQPAEAIEPAAPAAPPSAPPAAPPAEPPGSEPDPLRVPVEVAYLRTTEVPVLIEPEGGRRWVVLALLLIALAALALAALVLLLR